MSKHRKPKGWPQKRPTQRTTDGDLIVWAGTVKLLWRVAHAARAVMWAPEQEDCGASAHAILDEVIDDLDAHVRSGCA